MDNEEVVRRYAHRPGYELVAYEQIALPVLHVMVRVLVLDEKRLNALEEFSLRAVSLGFTTPAEVGDFLGLEAAVAEPVLVRLLESEDLAMGAAAGTERRHRLQLTTKGQRTLAELATVIPREVVIKVMVDMLTGDFFIDQRERFLRPQDVRKLGLRELAPKRRRRLETEDVPAESIARAFETSSRRRLARQHILSVLNIERRERLFYDDALALGFASDAGDVQLGIAINGQISAEHEAVLGDVASTTSHGLFTELRESLAVAASSRERIESKFGPMTLAAAKELSEQVEAASAALDRLREDAEQSTAGDVAVESTREQLHLREAEVTQLRERLARLEVRPVAVYAHPALLDQALSQAQTRLLIVSPWMNADVVSYHFLQKLEAALGRGVLVHIGYGITDRDVRADKASQERVVAKLSDLSTRARLLRFGRIGDTHAKVLLYDDAFVVVGSFNWLSFSGDPGRGFRDERSILTTLKSVIDEEYSYNADRIEEAISRGA